MTCDFKTLLPHPTGVELALEQDAAQKYCHADPAVIRTLFDPMECPAELLPWLAYALSVDVWNPQWPEATKRAVCANSLQMHIHKGTVGGVEDALTALGIRAEIVEWWQAAPVADVGTMQVTLWVNQVILPDADIILGAELVRDVKEQLDRSKRASIHYTYRLAVEASSIALAFNMTAQLNTLHRADAIQECIAAHAQALQISTGISGQLSTLHRVTASQENTDTAATPTQFGIGMSGQLSTLHRVTASQENTDTAATPTQFGIGMSGQISTLFRADAISDNTSVDAIPVDLLIGMTVQLSTLHRIEVRL